MLVMFLSISPETWIISVNVSHQLNVAVSLDVFFAN